MKKFSFGFFFIALSINISAYGYDKSDVRSCEGSGDDRQRALCYRGLEISNSCPEKVTAYWEEVDCYRRIVNEQLSMNLTLSRPEKIPQAITYEPSVEKARKICRETEELINSLVEYTTTVCLPGADKEQGALSLIFVSIRPVFYVEEAKKGWIVVVVGIVGDYLNNHTSIKGGELWLSDAKSMANSTAYVMPIEIAKFLQRKIKRDEISVDEMYSEISNTLIQKTISRE